MARNTEKYIYPEVPILKGSLLHQILSADAEAAGYSLADAIKARLALSGIGTEKNPPADWNTPSAPARAVQAEISQEQTRPSKKKQVTASKRPASSGEDEGPVREEESPAGFDLSQALASADLFDQLN